MSPKKGEVRAALDARPPPTALSVKEIGRATPQSPYLHKFLDTRHRLCNMLHNGFIPGEVPNRRKPNILKEVVVYG